MTRRDLFKTGILAILWLIAGFVPAARAQSEILVLYRSDIPLYAETARRLQERSRRRFLACPLETVTASFLETRTPPLIIALGEAGLKRAKQITTSIPIAATLIDSPSTDPQVRTLSTAFPLERQISILQRLTPGLKRIWMPHIACPFSNAYRPPAIPASINIPIDAAPLPSKTDLPAALRSLEPHTTGLILLPDPCLANDALLQSIFMTSFQKHCPLVGFSEAQVRKGAAFALTLTPEGLAEDLAQFVEELQTRTTFTGRAFTRWRLVLNKTILAKMEITIPADLLDSATRLY